MIVIPTPLSTPSIFPAKLYAIGTIDDAPIPNKEKPIIIVGKVGTGKTTQAKKQLPNAKVVWSYCTGEGDPTELIIYDIKTDSWSFVQIDHQIIYFGRSQGFTLEGLDSINSSLDALPASLDADLYKGGQLALFVFDTNNKSGTFNGSALTARIETGEVATEDMELLFCDRVRPLVTGATATNTVFLATRDSLNSDFTYTSGQTVNNIGEHNFRKTARYMRFRVDIAGGFDEAIGVCELMLPQAHSLVLD